MHPRADMCWLHVNHSSLCHVTSTTEIHVNEDVKKILPQWIVKMRSCALTS